MPKNIIIGKSFKDNLKLQIEIFIHYLLTISDEISIEKRSKSITINHIKDALYEIDHENIHKQLKEIYQNDNRLKGLGKMNIKKSL